MKSINGKTPNSLCSVGIKLRKRVRNSVLDVVDGIQTLAERITLKLLGTRGVLNFFWGRDVQRGVLKMGLIERIGAKFGGLLNWIMANN